MSKNDKFKKCDELIAKLVELKKALSLTNVSSNRKLMPSLGAGWSMDPGTGMFHHSVHGTIATVPNESKDGYHIKHGGGIVGRVKDMNEAGAKIKDYVGALGSYDTNMHNTSSGNLPGQTKMGKLTQKKEDEEDDVDKSDYGPSNASQYSVADNAKRKSKNIGDKIGEGPNVNVKAYSTRPGQLSSKQQAAIEAKQSKKLSGPIKQYTSEQIAAINEANKLKKNAENTPWVSHAKIPSADEEIKKLAKNNPVNKNEDLMANQLANLMQGRAMLGTPPKQPTDKEMFGHLIPDEDAIKKAESNWQNGINNWLKEANKPIASKFATPEDELAYWNSIKISDRDDGRSGY